VTGLWDRLLVGPVWQGDNRRFFGVWVRHGAVGVAGDIAGDVLQLLVYKVFHGQVLASMLAPGNWRHGPSRINGWNWQVGFLIWMWLWHDG